MTRSLLIRTYLIVLEVGLTPLSAFLCNALRQQRKLTHLVVKEMLVHFAKQLIFQVVVLHLAKTDNYSEVAG